VACISLLLRLCGCYTHIHWRRANPRFFSLDTVALRIVAAALFGIGFSSLQASELDYPSMVKKLRWAVIWSGTAWLGILISLLNGGHPLNWPFFIVFILFNVLWSYYAYKLGSFNNFFGSVKKLLFFDFD
jgi:hypothetical protein